MTDPQKQIGSLLNTARTQARQIQKTIANMVGVSKTTIERWESGTSLPPLGRCDAIATAYGLDTKEFSQVLEEAWVVHKKHLSNRKNATKIKNEKKVEESLFPGEIETSPKRRRANFLGGYDNTYHAKH